MWSPPCPILAHVSQKGFEVFVLKVGIRLVSTLIFLPRALARATTTMWSPPCPILAHVSQKGFEVVVWNECGDVDTGNLKENYIFYDLYEEA